MPISAVRFQDSIVVAELSSDLKEGRIVLLTPDGPQLLFNTTHGIKVPGGLAVREGTLWVSDWATGNVLQIAAEGEFLSTPVPVFSDLDHPEGLAVHPDGNLLVVESGAGTLSYLDIEIGMRTVVADNLALGAEASTDLFPPLWIFNGVAVGDSGSIYVTGDVGNVVYTFTR
jgi:DNA-binding beta-propeller fold protein YncE